MTSRGRDRNGGNGKRPETADDRDVWAHVARQVKPLKKKGIARDAAPAGRARATGKAASAAPPKTTHPKTAPPEAAPAEAAPRSRPSPASPPVRRPRSAPEGLAHPGGDSVDRRTDERLRKGRIRPEGRLDLHGLTQDEAHAALLSFLLSAHAAGKRCVLVITGKGGRRPPPRDSRGETGFPGAPRGILRERVPGWLGAPPLNRIVLRAYGARPQDGGSGALYILLRRTRDA